MKKPLGVTFACGPSKSYFYGDPCPDKALGYMEFVEWQEAQLRKRRRPKEKKRVDKTSTVE
jgi:hypothetical protein